MTSFIAAVFLVGAFIVLARLFRLVEKTYDVIAVSRDSLEVVRNPVLGEDDKEKALQKNAVHLMRLFFVIVFRCAAAIFIPMGVLWIFQKIGWLSMESVFSTLASPVFLIAAGGISVFALFVCRGEQDQKADYSFLERLLHRLSFRTYAAQISLADFEDRMFSRDLAAFNADNPVFITALPRAGTTMILERLAKLPEYASHTYRDMPFVLIPCFWSMFSSAFQGTGELRERAHGDGVMIDFDSPEAMEGVLWKAFWRRRYQNGRIKPIVEENNDEFIDFFKNHMRKIIFLRGKKDVRSSRYLSKNNLNIAHIRLLKASFPKAAIIIPFRAPLQHAASLLNQHLNFLNIHQNDRFAAEYMAAIGHFDFGRNLRPVNFNNWLDTRVSKDDRELLFWLEYWTAAYRFLLHEAGYPGVHLVDYDALCENPEEGLQVIAEALGYCSPDELIQEADSIRPAAKHEPDAANIPSNILEEANGLYFEMKKIALNTTAF